jgi:hypothetical protein
MNEKAVKKYFLDAWKWKIFIARTNDGKLWLSDNVCIINIKETDLVLESRRVFPTIPAVGESFRMSKSDSITKDFNKNLNEGPDIEGLINRSLNNKKLKPLQITDWYKYLYPCYLRRFETQNEQKIFINVNVLNLIESNNNICEYNFFGTKPNEIVIVKDQDELIALLMPIQTERMEE